MNAQPQTIEGTAVETIPTRRPTEIRVVTDPIAVLDTARFEHMQRIASVMAKSNLIPDGLCLGGGDDGKDFLPIEAIIANCFLVVNQAVRWGMDPFAVTQCVSVVHGKLCYEGKLIAAVLEAKLGTQLEYDIHGDGEAMRVIVSAAIDGRPVVDSQGRLKTVTGTVADWKTTGIGSPWAARGGYPRMLRYRGAREWARVHAPGLMLGVYSDDEMADLTDDARANRARNVTPIEDARQARQEAQAEPRQEARTLPPNPNGAPARPRPPNPMGETAAAAKDPMEIPAKLVRVDPEKLKARLLNKIMGFGTKEEATEYAARIDVDTEPLGTPDRAIVAKAYDARRKELEGDGG